MRGARPLENYIHYIVLEPNFFQRFFRTRIKNVRRSTATATTCATTTTTASTSTGAARSRYEYFNYRSSRKPGKAKVLQTRHIICWLKHWVLLSYLDWLDQTSVVKTKFSTY